MRIVNANFLLASNEILASAYNLNTNLRNNTLQFVPDLYNKFSTADVTLFNERYSEYTQTLTYTGNSVELLILAAIAGMVGSNALIKRRIQENYLNFRRDLRWQTSTL